MHLAVIFNYNEIFACFIKNIEIFTECSTAMHKIIPEFFENFKSIRSGCFGSGGKTCTRNTVQSTII
jgi:hypothetical protein